VTPSKTPKFCASLICSRLAVSIKNFIKFVISGLSEGIIYWLYY
jgi:hypothetical protein